MNTSHISIGPQGTTSRKTARGQLLFERLIRFATGWGLPERLVRRGQSVACIFLLLSLMTLCVNTATAQGALTNGWTHTGTISSVGDSDSWTFSASIGDSIVIRVGEITQTGSFTPRIRLQNPNAVQIASASGAVSAEIAVTATNTGTFTLIVDDAVGTTATGTYRLTLAKSPGTIFVMPGDEGGPMTNGVMHVGTIDLGDLDVWTFSANSGDAVIVRMGEVVDTSGNFEPWVRLYGPNGKLLDSSFGVSAAEVAGTATKSGTFTVVVGEGNGEWGGRGKVGGGWGRARGWGGVCRGRRGGADDQRGDAHGNHFDGRPGYVDVQREQRGCDRCTDGRDHQYKQLHTLGEIVWSERQTAEFKLRSLSRRGDRDGDQQRNIYCGGGRRQRRAQRIG